MNPWENFDPENLFARAPDGSVMRLRDMMGGQRTNAIVQPNNVIPPKVQAAMSFIDWMHGSRTPTDPQQFFSPFEPPAEPVSEDVDEVVLRVLSQHEQLAYDSALEVMKLYFMSVEDYVPPDPTVLLPQQNSQVTPEAAQFIQNQVMEQVKKFVAARKEDNEDSN